METGIVSKVAVLPAPSVTTTEALRLAPSPVTTTGLLMLVEAIPDRESDVSNAKRTSPPYQPAELAAGDGAPKTSWGGVASRLIVAVCVVVPPADVAVHVNVMPAVSVTMLLAPQPSLESMGAYAPVVVQLTCTSLVYQPLVPGVPEMSATTLGAARSMFTAGVENVAVLPAISVTTTSALRLAPTPTTTAGLLVLVVATPEVSSLAMNGKLTSPLFQPAALAAGVGAPNSSTGAVASRMMVTDCVVEPPADVTVQVNVTPVVSPITEPVSHPEVAVMAASSSVAFQ